MADRSKRRAELEAELAALEDDDASDDEVTIRRGDDSFTGTWRRAVQVAKGWGFTLTAPEPEDDEDEAPKGKRGGDVKRFQSGRRVS